MRACYILEGMRALTWGALLPGASGLYGDHKPCCTLSPSLGTPMLRPVGVNEDYADKLHNLQDG